MRKVLDRLMFFMLNLVSLKFVNKMILMVMVYVKEIVVVYLLFYEEGG